MLLLTLRGTPILYYGDELGMVEGAVTEANGRDPWGELRPWLTRDGCRTPMQWSYQTNAGFTPAQATPWLPVSPDYTFVNVDSQLDDLGSTLNLYRRLLAFRRESVCLRFGSFLSHPSSTEDVFVYRRESDHQTMTIALNFSGFEQTVAVGRGEVVVSTIDPERGDSVRDKVRLAPTEGVIVAHA